VNAGFVTDFQHGTIVNQYPGATVNLDVAIDD
jgi:hypothetical protein